MMKNRFAKCLIGLLMSAYLTVCTHADTYTNNFDSWDGAPTPDVFSAGGSYLPNSDGWIVNDGGVSDGNGAIFLGPNTSPYAAWLGCFYADPAYVPWIQSPELPDGAGTIAMNLFAYAAGGGSVFAVETSTDGGASWTTNGSITCSNQAWTSASLALNVYTNVYVRISKTNEFGNTPQWVGVDDISITLPPSRVIITNVTLSPVPQLINTQTLVTATIIPQSLANNISATLCYSTDGGIVYHPVSMTTTGAYYYVTAPGAIPAMTSVASKVYYYILTTFDGFYNHTNYWPSTAPLANACFITHRAPFTSQYSNMFAKGPSSLSTNMILTANNQWQIVTTNINLSSPAFYFQSGTTNWGAVNQAISNMPVYGTAVTNDTDIFVIGTLTNRLSFMFNDTNLSYSIENCAYADFSSGWAVSATNFGTYTNTENWIISSGRVNNAGETNLSFRGSYCILPSTQGIQFVKSPNLTNGIGLVSFWYRNYSSTAAPPAGLTLQKSVDNATWIDVIQVTNIISADYLYFTNTIGNTNYHYVRILNITNSAGAGSPLCIDDIVVSEPRAIVTLSNAQLITATPISGDPVSVSVDYAAARGASNPTCRVYYRAPGASTFDSTIMTSNSTTFSGSIPAMPPGQVDYYFVCTYNGFRAAPAEYPTTAPVALLSYVNSSAGTTYRDQNFDTWATTAEPPPTNNNPPNTDGSEWYINDGSISDGNGALFFAGSSSPNATWLGAFSYAPSYLPWIQSPLLTNGVGTIYLNSCTYTPGGGGILELQTSADGITWKSNGCITCSTPSWTSNSFTINVYSNVYVRLCKISEFGTTPQWLGIDDIVVSPPPADVIITNISFSPGYPGASDPVTIQATVTSTDTNFPAFSISPKVCYLSSAAGSLWQTNNMTWAGGNIYAAIIPALPAGTVSYCIRCDFDGYYYTNGVISEKMSPAFSPDAPPTVELPSQFYSYEVRRFQSTFNSVIITGNMGAISMQLAADNQWQGVLKYTNSAPQLSMAFAGFQQYTGGVYLATTNFWGDSDQIKFTLPQYSIGDAGGSNIIVNMDTQYYGAVIFRFNTSDNSYIIRRGAYQDFNSWGADPVFFEESLDLYSISAVQNDFTDWATNITFVTTNGLYGGLEDYESSTQTFAFLNYYELTNNPSTNLWYVDKAEIRVEASSNHVAVLQDVESNGKVFPDKARRTDGLQAFSFDYRVTSIDNYTSIYSPGPFVSWSNLAVEAYMRCSDCSPSFPYISIFSRVADINNYYEYRLGRYDTNNLQLLIVRKSAGTSTILTNTIPFVGLMTNQTHLCKFITVTNNNGDVNLESYYNNQLMLSYTDPSSSAINSPGSIGFFSREADILVDSVSVKFTDIQRFTNWSKGTAGTYTNNGWVITSGYPSNLTCTLVGKPDTQSATTNFDSWPVTNWGTYTNAAWVLSDGCITSATSAYSPSNFVMLKNDGSNSNAWLQAPGFSNAIDRISFYCKNVGTNSIQFQVLTSADSNNWVTNSALTFVNTNNSFSFTRKVKIPFKGYNKNETLTNFPALIVLSTNIPGFDYSTFTSTNYGFDLRFTDSSEARELNYEIERWDTRATTNFPSDIQGLQLWLVGGSGITTNANGVTTWLDQSGNGRNAVQGVAARQPQYATNVINGLPVLRFNGANEPNGSRLTYPALNAGTVFIVNRLTNGQPDTLVGIIEKVGTDMSIRRGSTNAWSHPGNGSDFSNPGGSLFQVNGSNTANVAEKVWHILMAARNGSTVVCDSICGGAWGNRNYKGDIAEVIVYNRMLDTNEINQVGWYLTKKFALATSYVSPATSPLGKSLAWVQVPAISSTNSYIWACWGGAGLTNQPAYTTNGSTWSSDYEGVWHMNDTNILDSTGKGYSGGSYYTSNTLGAFTGSGAQLFNGANSYIGLPAGMASFPAITISLWAYPTATKNWARFIDFGNGAPNNNLIFARNGGGSDLDLTVYDGGNGNPQLNAAGQIINSQWQHFVATINTNGTANIYKNGVKVVVPTQIPRMRTATRMLNYIGRSNWANDQYYQGYIDEMNIASVERSSNWVWATWYNTASNSAFCDYTNSVLSVPSSAFTNWNLYTIGPLSNSTKYVRLYKSQVTSPGQWLGLDNVSLLTPAPNITSPYLTYTPANLRFNYTITAQTGMVVVLASSDYTNWTTLAGPLSGTPGIPYAYQSPNIAGYRYFRIENQSISTNATINDIYITQTSNTYFETFDGSAAGWPRDGIWSLNTNQQAWTRKGYPGGPVNFLIETNNSQADYGTWNFPPDGPGWGTYTAATASNLNWKHLDCFIYDWNKIYPRIRHTTGTGNLVLDNLCLSSWHDAPSFTDSNGWTATEVWVAPIDSVNTNNHVLEFWKSRANPANIQGLTSPYMTNGVGMLSFDYKCANGPIDFEVWTTSSIDTNDWIVLTNSITTAYNGGWKTFTLPINQTNSQYVKIVHKSSKSVQTYLTYDYYTYAGNWSVLPNFDIQTPDQSGVCTNFTTSQITPLPSTNYAFRWKGKINLPSPGLWTFWIASDDGSKLYFDGTLTINNDGQHGVVTNTASTNIVVAGWHDIEVQFFQNGGGAYWETPKYQGPGQIKASIPDSALIYNGGPVLTIDNVQLSDYRVRDEKMWWAYNALITSNQLTRGYEGKTCYLNNSILNGTRPGITFPYFLPCVQSPELKKGIGEINFWYRRWDDTGTNAATIYVRSSTNYATADSDCSTLFVLSGITNTDYRFFSTNLYITTNFYLRISSSTNTTSSRFCVDNIGIYEPISADLDIGDVVMTPAQPLFTDRVNFAVELKNFVYSPRNIDTRVYYYVGTSNNSTWATNWPATNYITLDQVVSSNAYTRVLTSATNIPPQAIDKVVQYYVSCSFTGFFSSFVSPRISTNFTNPSWYTPVNLNSGKPQNIPYYFVYSCPTGSAWINEVNYNNGASSQQTNEFIEVCGKAGINVGNWSIQILNNVPTLIDQGTIPNGWIIPNETNGFGFVVYGDTNIATADITFATPSSQNIPKNGAARLVRSIGAWEHKVCWGNASALTNSGYQYIGVISLFDSSSLALTGTGSNLSDFAWALSGSYSPGTANGSQVFTGPAATPLPTITINTCWKVSSTFYVKFTSTATNDILPSPWYCTDLTLTNWTAVTNPVTTNYYQPTGIYTQSFTALTNNPVYFYKIISTNVP